MKLIISHTYNRVGSGTPALRPQHCNVGSKNAYQLPDNHDVWAQVLADSEQLQDLYIPEQYVDAVEDPAAQEYVVIRLESQTNSGLEIEEPNL